MVGEIKALAEAVKEEGEIKEYIRGVNIVQYLTFKYIYLS
jgi:hypothetical protein